MEFGGRRIGHRHIAIDSVVWANLIVGLLFCSNFCKLFASDSGIGEDGTEKERNVIHFGNELPAKLGAIEITSLAIFPRATGDVHTCFDHFLGHVTKVLNNFGITILRLKIWVKRAGFAGLFSIFLLSLKALIDELYRSN